MIKFLKDILKKKIVIIILIIVLILICLFVVFSLVISKTFKLKGDSVVNIEYNTEYKEYGATNLFNLDVKIESNLDTTKVGKYKIKYVIDLLFLKFYKYRVVNVIDEVKPVITLTGDQERTICPSTIYEEEGYSATDDYDGDITESVKIINSEDGITYEVSDSSGNVGTAFRKIKKQDDEVPKLSLKGNSTVYIKVGTKYSDSGYNVSDNCDTEVTVSSENNINTSVVGKYIYKYKATDTNQNVSEVVRNVVVYEEGGEGVIYLTFDDGPSGTGSTAKILDVLKEEGVQATFFVTCSGPDSLIKREYEEGHTVALHTKSHNYYVLYKTVDAYFEDLNAVRNRVYNLLGYYSNIIRFPGGSNNTVSISASGYKIMDTLVKEVVNRGYTYFDWNVSSGDAGGCTTSTCVYNNTINGLSKSRNNVILMHDIKMFTANALKDIIEYAKANGYTFKVIDETTSPVRFKW